MSEELDALRAIFSNDDEFKIISKGGTATDTVVQIHIVCDTDSSPIKVTATFTLSPDYPLVVPGVSVYCEQITREHARQMKEDILSYAALLTGQPMIMDVVLWIQQNVAKYLTPTKHNAGNCLPKLFTALLHFDHMRSKGKYVKTIQKWTDELCLSGRLIFHGNFIFLLLQGRREDIKEYIVRQKTVNVDVDSKGRGCKERMMKIIAEEELADCLKRIPEFQVVEASSFKDVHEIFIATSLESFFNQHLLSFYKKS